jgi:putative ribosome biogenesis GTPase RsgA
LLTINLDVQLILAANKRDLADQQQLTLAQIEAIAASLGAAHYLTSAKTGNEVESVFRHLSRLLVV